MAKKIGLIEDETCLDTWIIAIIVKGEAQEFTTLKLPWKELKNYLCSRAQELYESNPDVRKKIRGKGNAGRDYLYCFFRHWSAGWLVKQGVPKEDISKKFCNGEEE